VFFSAIFRQMQHNYRNQPRESEVSQCGPFGRVSQNASSAAGASYRMPTLGESAYVNDVQS
jgi:hypothetical protein